MSNSDQRLSNGATTREGLRSVGEFRITCDLMTWLAVMVGIILRVAEYARNRSLYRDEESLLLNLVNLPVFDLWTRLTEYQLAPPGFLILERIMVRLPFPVVPSARFIPLLCGISSMFLMRKVGKAYLNRDAVPIAVAFFALCDYLLYYSSEIKQYSGEVMFALLGFLVAARPVVDELSNRRRLALLTAFGAISTWFSFSMALVLGGLGLRYVFVAWKAHRRDLVFKACGMCMVWGISFGICFGIGQRLLDRSDSFISDWWAFAFLPFPPRSLRQLDQTFWQLANVFINPACLHTPLNEPYSGLVDLAVFLLGVVSLARRWRGGTFLLLAPLAFALAASVLEKYPFHGRLLLFLIPTIHLFTAQGVLAFGQRFGRFAAILLASFLLFQPIANCLWNELVMVRSRTFDSHGDLYPDLLDYFEIREHREKIDKHFRLDGLPSRIQE
ncbi:hypothetical protein [Singulisphaera sp. PoT]|uniref:hypothetical protein n=1 Tax=Singulisphaera sp. PoT TaxID=3411797 RepID=UPI003BF58029